MQYCMDYAKMKTMNLENKTKRVLKMADMKQILNECKRVCEKYEKEIGGYEPGGLYNLFCDEVINMAFLIAACDGNVSEAELTTINDSFMVLTNYDMLLKRYGTDYLSEESFLHKVPEVIRLVARAEKEAHFGGKSFLSDTRVLYKGMKQFGNIIIHCSGARLKFAIMLLDFFTNGILEYIFSVEDQDDLLESISHMSYKKEPESLQEMENIDRIQLQRHLAEDKKTLFNRNQEENITEINEILAKVDALIGLDNVKKEVHDIVNLLIVQKMREKSGLKSPNISRHLVFTGNPGTGKTTIARMMAEIYKSLGILQSGHLVETDRSGLVAGYMGQTAEKVKEVTQSAMGGVLFIDEAYTLINNKEGDYGQEAVDTLLKIMEDCRDNLIVIVAGYSDLMEQFLDSNPGLRSRFNKYIQFTDYSEQELLRIFKGYCKDQDYRLAENMDAKILEKIQEMKGESTENFGNARTMRNYFEKVISNQANRLIQSAGMHKNSDADILAEIIVEDL